MTEKALQEGCFYPGSGTGICIGCFREEDIEKRVQYHPCLLSCAIVLRYLGLQFYRSGAIFTVNSNVLIYHIMLCHILIQRTISNIISIVMCNNIFIITSVNSISHCLLAFTLLTHFISCIYITEAVLFLVLLLSFQSNPVQEFP